MRIAGFILTLSLALASDAAAATATPSETIVTLRAIAAEENWTELEDRARAAGERLARRLATVDPVPYAAVAAYRALAHHHLGDSRLARWYWQVALNFAPDVAIEEIARHPEAAAVLAQTALPTVESSGGEPGVRPATMKKPVRPELVVFKRGRKPVAFSVQLVIDAEGRTNDPRVIGQSASDSDVVYDILESLRLTRYSPASTAEGPIDSVHRLDISIGFPHANVPKNAKRF